jgi:hypothetical protein
MFSRCVTDTRGNSISPTRLLIKIYQPLGVAGIPYHESRKNLKFVYGVANGLKTSLLHVTIL